MKRSVIALLFAALICPSMSGAVHGKEPLKHFLRAVIARPLISGYGSFVADADGDGTDELFVDRGVALTGLRLHGNELIPFDEWKYRDAGEVRGFCDAPSGLVYSNRLSVSFIIRRSPYESIIFL